MQKRTKLILQVSTHGMKDEIGKLSGMSQTGVGDINENGAREMIDVKARRGKGKETASRLFFVTVCWWVS